MSSYEIIVGNCDKKRVRLSVVIFETLTRIRLNITRCRTSVLLVNENLPSTDASVNVSDVYEYFYLYAFVQQ